MQLQEEVTLAFTFKGGIHVEEHKYKGACPTETMPNPATVKISMTQHNGTPCIPSVKKGDRVRIGQIIGDASEDALGCPVHASVSGTVLDIEELPVSIGAPEKAVVIENDEKDELDPSVVPFNGSIRELSPEDIISRVRRAGICDGTLPAYAKISAACGRIEYLIVNCVERDPFVTSCRRLISEHPEKVARGTKILMRAIRAPQAYIAVDGTVSGDVRRLKRLCEGDRLISVQTVKSKYPHGDERQLIYALTGREVPADRCLEDAGCVVLDARTCAEVYDAIATGMPSVRCTVTVSGDCIAEPKNLSVPVGASVSELIDFCGGSAKAPDKLVIGTAMTGEAQSRADIPVKKSTSAVLLLSKKYTKEPKGTADCIRCGRCVRSCPMRLMPAYIAMSVRADDMKGAERFGAVSCTECGVCSYICPAKVELVQYVRRAKEQILAEKERAQDTETDAK